MTYTEFKKEWNGRRIDYDHVFNYQCVDLILQFVKECGGVATGVWGNAIDYANNPTDAFTKATTKVTNGKYKAGDIVVLKGLDGNKYGHIGLFDHGNVALLEQNGYSGGGTGLGKDAVSVWRTISPSRIAAVYRLKKFVDTTPKPLPNGNKTSVTFPSTAGPWHVYKYGSSYSPNDLKAVAGVIRPDLLGSLTYHIESWVGDSAVVIQTRDFGRVVAWVKGTPAKIS